MSTSKQRRLLAYRFVATATNHGARCLIEPCDRSLYVSCDFPDKVRVSFDIDDLHDGGVLISFHNAVLPLNPGPHFDSVNKHHWSKATVYRDSAVEALAAFEVACKAIADGSAFHHGT